MLTNAFSGLSKITNNIATLANVVGTLMVLGLVAIVNYDIFARGLFNMPFRGAVEVVQFAMVLIVFLQLPDVVRNNRLTRSDGFLVFAQDRYPGISNVLSRSIDAIAAVFMALIAWTVWPEFLESIGSCHFITPPEFGAPPTGEFWADLKTAFARCEYFGTPGIFTAPWWPAKLAIFFSVTLCAIIFAFKALLGNRNPVLVDSGESPV